MQESTSSLETIMAKQSFEAMEKGLGVTIKH
jgi:hypothetical protein